MTARDEALDRIEQEVGVLLRRVRRVIHERARRVDPELVDLGLVDRTPDPADGRATLIAVTEEGVRRLAAVAAERRSLFAGRLSDWTPDDLTDLADRLHRYNAALDPDD